MVGNDSYELDVFGETEDGRPVGGPERSYVHHIDFKRLPLGISWVPGAVSKIRQERPDVVMIQNDPYSALSWVAPPVVQSYGGVAIAWSKVTSFSNAPAVFKGFVKRRLFSMYDLSVVYGEEAAKELAGLGYPRSKIFVATNTIDTRRIFTSGNLFRVRGRKLRAQYHLCLLYTSPSPRDGLLSRMPSSA